MDRHELTRRGLLGATMTGLAVAVAGCSDNGDDDSDDTDDDVDPESAIEDAAAGYVEETTEDGRMEHVHPDSGMTAGDRDEGWELTGIEIEDESDEEIVARISSSSDEGFGTSEELTFREYDGEWLVYDMDF